MSIHLKVPQPGWDTSVTIIFVCNHLYRIYYTLKKESRWMVVVEKKKDTRVTRVKYVHIAT